MLWGFVCTFYLFFFSLKVWSIWSSSSSSSHGHPSLFGRLHLAWYCIFGSFLHYLFMWWSFDCRKVWCSEWACRYSIYSAWDSLCLLWSYVDKSFGCLFPESFVVHWYHHDTISCLSFVVYVYFWSWLCYYYWSCKVMSVFCFPRGLLQWANFSRFDALWIRDVLLIMWWRSCCWGAGWFSDSFVVMN